MSRDLLSFEDFNKIVTTDLTNHRQTIKEFAFPKYLLPISEAMGLEHVLKQLSYMKTQDSYHIHPTFSNFKLSITYLEYFQAYRKKYDWPIFLEQLSKSPMNLTAITPKDSPVLQKLFSEALLHVVNDKDEKWKGITDRWELAENIIQHFVIDFSTYSGALKREHAIDRMISNGAPFSLIYLALEKGAWIGRSNLLDALKQHPTFEADIQLQLQDAILKRFKDSIKSIFEKDARSSSEVPVDEILSRIIHLAFYDINELFNGNGASILLSLNAIKEKLTQYVNSILALSKAKSTETVEPNQSSFKDAVDAIYTAFISANTQVFFDKTQTTLFIKRCLITHLIETMIKQNIKPIMEQYNSMNDKDAQDVVSAKLGEIIKKKIPEEIVKEFAIVYSMTFRKVFAQEYASVKAENSQSKKEQPQVPIPHSQNPHAMLAMTARSEHEPPPGDNRNTASTEADEKRCLQQ